MTDVRCECGRVIRHVPPGPMARRLAALGDEWTVVAVGASRFYADKLRRRHPDAEVRHRREANGTWTIEARRRP